MFTTKLSTSNFKMIFFSFRLLSPLQLLRVYAHTQLNWLLNIYIFGSLLSSLFRSFHWSFALASICLLLLTIWCGVRAAIWLCVRVTKMKWTLYHCSRNSNNTKDSNTNNISTVRHGSTATKIRATNRGENIQILLSNVSWISHHTVTVDTIFTWYGVDYSAK